MNSAHYRHLKLLFDEASALPIDSREEFVADRCGEDLTLRDELLRMLAHAESPLGIFDATPEIDADAGEPSLPESAVPGYALQRKIGEGGFGVVYEARQLRPVVRPVALKLIKYGFESTTIKSRFTIECQALARLDHPSIARVFDAGTTPTGHLFCAMELVDGVSIRDYANEHRLSIRQRLELMLPVCEAVQHAHQRGILHRDLKPSNILVTRSSGRALPKIIDFGIAKIRDDDDAEMGGLTLSGEFIGTPIYMSPEQADPGRSEVDTRSDVYSLAVVLYELLTGTTPLRLDRATDTGLEGMLRSLREDDVQLASRRVRDLGEDAARQAQRCGTKPDGLVRELQGDLDRILAMALEKDRSRRYESPQQFGADLARLLRNEAVLAQSPTTSYLLRKFARRHRGKLAFAATVFVLLVAGVIGTTIGLVNALEAQTRESQQRDVAESEARISREVVAFLNDDLLASVAPEGLGIDVTMREALDSASERIEGRFPGLPAVEVAVRTTLGATYRSLAINEPALHHLERARSLSAEHMDANDVRRLRALRELGATLYAMRRYDDAEPLLVDVLDRSVRVFGEGSEETLAAAFHLGGVYAERQDQTDAFALVERWLPISRRELGPAHPQTLQFAFGLGHIHMARNEQQKALETFDAAWHIAHTELGPTHRITLLLSNDLAVLKFRAGAKSEAEALLRDAWQASAGHLGEAHPTTLNLKMKYVSALLSDTGRTDEVNALIEEMFETWPTVLSADNPLSLRLWLLGARSFLAQEQTERAAELLEKVVRFEDSAPREILLHALSQLHGIADRAGDAAAARAWKERFERVRAREPSGH